MDRQKMLDQLDTHRSIIEALADEDLSYGPFVTSFYCTGYDDEGKPDEIVSLAKVRRIMRVMKNLGATVTKTYNDFNFTTTCEFDNGLRYQLSIEREVVCAKKVVSTEWVPPAEGYARDIVEWVCDDLPILSGE